MTTIDREQTTLSPKVSGIVSALAERIESGEYKPGDFLPAERALAEEFQVSRILIRSALKELDQRRLVSCSAHRRPLVRATRSHRPAPITASRSIAVWIWPQMNWPGSSMTIHGIQAALGNEFRLFLGNSAVEAAEQVHGVEAEFLRQVLHAKDVEGLIIGYSGGTVNLPYLEALRAAHVPMVFLDRLPPTGFDGDFVGVSNRWSAEQAVKHLLSLGHRRIAHLSVYDTVSTVADRLAGYRRALENAGIPFRPELVEKDPGPPSDDPEKGCEALIDRLLSLPDPPTALFAVHDVAAYRAIAALRARGLRIPEDMSVVGFDGIERWMPCTPFLTTVPQPFDELGVQAAELVRERIRRGPDSPYIHTIINASLMVYGSTRPLD